MSQPDDPGLSLKSWSPRKIEMRDFADKVAPQRNNWIARNRFYYEDHYRYLDFVIPHDASVLDLGCGTGDLLNALKPVKGVGIDLSEVAIEIARKENPDFEFFSGDIEDPTILSAIDGPFDVIVLSDTIGMLEDIAGTLKLIQPLCNPETRIIVSYYSQLWAPALKIAEFLGLKQKQLPLNWLSAEDIQQLLLLADFDIIKREWRQLIPKRFFGVGTIVNKLFGWLPGIRQLCLRNYIVARPTPSKNEGLPSVSVIIPCRNERGNIEDAVRRMPRFCKEIELLFVEGDSIDGTAQEIDRVIHLFPDWNIRSLQQTGKGKGDAVRQGFTAAQNNVLMILDADLTVSPEALPQFYDAFVAGKGEFINGSRLIYPMDPKAMRFLNLLANRAFSVLFSWLLNQRLTDTLCGTKVLSKRNYEKIAASRTYFGEFDPFGDYDLLFGASKLNLKMAEVPIRYAARTYGETQISRFSDGWLLIRMVFFAWRKMKAF